MYQGRQHTLDNRQVYARNASLLGFATRRVKAGSVFTYDDAGQIRLARSLGRVSAPADGPHIPEVKGWVLAMVLSSDASFCYVRWVNPDDITRVHESAPTAMAAFFFAPDLPYDGATILRLIDHGTTQNQFIEKHAERVAMFRERAKNATIEARD